MSMLRRLTLGERTLTIVGAICVVLASVALAGGHPSEPLDGERPRGIAPGSPDPTPGPTPQASPANGLLTTAGPTIVRKSPHPDSPQVSALRAGIHLPVLGAVDGFYGVLTPCDVEGYVPASDVHTHEPAPEEFPDSLEDATFVLDPGHGGLQPGAVGPAGLTEADINLNLVRRLAWFLNDSRSIDPETGAVVAGGDFGAARVFLTRDAEFTLSLRYRAAMAAVLRAHGFISIHNNAEPDGELPRPGTETFHQVHSEQSRRLGGLIYEELVGVFNQYDLPWVGDRDAGAKYRTNEEGGDYYGVLRRTQTPAVLVEALYISNPPEEALLRNPDVQHQIAEALYRALVRYIETDDPGSGFIEPYSRGSGAPSRVPTRCVDPA